MIDRLAEYEQVVGKLAISQLHQLAEHLQGATVVHVNSTKEGGGVAEILKWLVPLMNDFGLNARWEIIEGNDEYFKTTKSFHNGLQGRPTVLSKSMQQAYEGTVEENANRLRPILEEADFVIILKPRVTNYDASIFSMAEFAQPLPHPQFLIAPSIDPLSDKNCDLPVEELDNIISNLGIPRELPILTQISRFDRFKDPIGVIEAFKMISENIEAELVLAGGGATDDPEGAAMLEEVKNAANGDERIHILFLPSDAHRTINALQRASTIVIQKSLQEGFGLTVTEALWKGKPVIGGNVGGIRRQVHNYYTGFLVDTPEGAALRIRYLLRQPGRIKAFGEIGRQFVKENFLLTRHLREYLTLMQGLKQDLSNRLLAD